MTELSLAHSEFANKKGRPSFSYSEGSVRRKRKIASVVSSAQGNDAKLLIHAASIAAHSSKENDLNFVKKKNSFISITAI